MQITLSLFFVQDFKFRFLTSMLKLPSFLVLAQDNISLYIIHRFKFSRDITVSTSIMIMKMNERPQIDVHRSSSFLKISLFISLFLIVDEIVDNIGRYIFYCKIDRSKILNLYIYFRNRKLKIVFLYLVGLYFLEIIR